jgi:hypothetical protein
MERKYEKATYVADMKKPDHGDGETMQTAEANSLSSVCGFLQYGDKEPTFPGGHSFEMDA